MPTRCVIEGVKNVVFKDVGEFIEKKKDVGEEKNNGIVKNLWNNKKINNNVCCSDESSSSIGKNSDLSENNSFDKLGDCEEVQSSYKGPLNDMEDLEQVLPIKRGISRFYNGKSKSFASLSEASSLPSVKEIAKADNAYSRKRRNLLACSLILDKNRSSSTRVIGGGIGKKVNNSGRSTLALGLAMANFESDKQGGECNFGATFFESSKRNKFSPWKSFSLADLQQCGSSNQLASGPS